MMSVAAVFSAFCAILCVQHAVGMPTSCKQLDELTVKYTENFPPEDVAACSVTITENRDKNRYPEIIRRVTCGSSCHHCQSLSYNGTQFSCVQIYSSIKVFYKDTLKEETVKGIPIDCRCMTHKGSRSETATQNIV